MPKSPWQESYRCSDRSPMVELKGASLYQRLLGEQFEMLPAALQEFHGRTDGGRGQGEFQVRRGRGRIRNWLASLLGLPAAAASVPVRLEVIVERRRERWIRHF